MTGSLTELFAPPPQTWGVRGDLYLWEELAAHFATVPVPNSANGVRVALVEAIATLTGAVFDGRDLYQLARYPSEGVSNNYISLSFWELTAIPLLVSRYKGQAPKTRDYFAELYVAGLFGDSGWTVYFPKRDVGFDFVVSKSVAGTMLLRPVQVKGLYPTAEKRDQPTYGFNGKLSATHPEMVVAMPFFSAVEREVAPACIAFLPLTRMRHRERGGVRCEPCRLSGGLPMPRPSYARYMDETGLAALEESGWSTAVSFAMTDTN